MNSLLFHPMNSFEIQTCTEGPTIKVTNYITRMDFVELCRNLTKEFGEGHKFIPEAITEGGIRWETWPGDDMNSRTYKSMRIRVNNYYGSNGVVCKWPNITTSTVMSDWESDDTILIRPSKTKRLDTFLKAYRGAPVWTLEELRKFKKCLKQFGLEMGKMPNKKDLIHKQDY